MGAATRKRRLTQLALLGAAVVGAVMIVPSKAGAPAADHALVMNFQPTLEPDGQLPTFQHEASLVAAIDETAALN